MGTSRINISFTFLHIVCAVVSPTGSRPPSRNRNNEMPGDEELGFEAAVAALGKIICLLFLSFCLLLFLFLNMVYISSLLPSPQSFSPAPFLL